MEVITYEIQQQVKVRKYNVDCKKLCNLLRTHKKLTGLNNKRIAELLNVSITKVEHWFRKDKCFSIPDEDVWLSLKQILNIATNDFDLAITTFEEKDNVFEKGNRIYDSKGIAPTITCGDAGLTILERIDTMEVKIIGQMDNTIDHTFESANRVYDVGGVSPTINTCGGGGLQPKILEDAQAIRMVRTEEGKALRKEYESGAIHHGFNEHREMELRTDGVSNTLSTVQKDNYICEKSIVAMRGRNPDNPSDRTAGSPTEQRLEPNSQGICNTLTSVQKDNLVMEKVIIDDTYANREPRVYEDYSPALRSEREGLKTIETISTKGKQIEVASTILAGYERTNMTGFNADNGVVEVMSDEKRNAIEILQTLRKEIGEKDFSEWSIRGLWCVLQEEILRQNLYAKGIYENWTHRPELFKFSYNSKGNQYSIYSEKAMRNMWEEWTVRCTPQRRGLSEQQCREFDDFMSKLPYEATQRKRFVYCLWKTSEGIGLLREALSEIQKVWEPTNYQEMQRCAYRIRKLTPLSCWRLMDFTDDDFEKAAQVNSNTQLYKQAGNSIVRNVLVAILGQMISGKEEIYKNI